MVTATDTSGLSASETFAADLVAPAAPKITNQTANQTWTIGKAMDFTLSSSTFIDPQGENLTYSAKLANGSALPSWLTFNATTRTFTGTVPNTANGLSIVVTATDTGGASTSETFSVLTPVTIASGQTFEITSASADAVTFAGSTGTLELAQWQTFTGTVAGLNGQDRIDLVGFGTNAKLSYAANSGNTGGTLTATDGSLVAHIALLGQYAASSFVAASDGHGGSIITYPVTTTETHLTQPHA